MSTFPEFGVSAYVQLLHEVHLAGLPILPVTKMKDHAGAAVFLRHDVDFSPELVLPIARAEAELGVRSTFYLLLSGPYDLKSPANHAAIRELRALNHEMGLHYDLRTYPDTLEEQRVALENEIRELESVLEVPIQTITMHEPHRNSGDPFRNGQWIHPHRKEWFDTVHYISDTVEQRDDGILRLKNHSLSRVLLLTHPELWLDPEQDDCLEYLRNSVTPHASEKDRPYFEAEVPGIWENHLGTWKHDLRESLRRAECAILPITKEWVNEHLDPIQTLFSNTPELPWTAPEIQLDVPGKWETSLVILRDGEPVAVSFNSIREEHLYIHAILTGETARKSRFGSLLLQALKIRAREEFKGILLRVGDSNSNAFGWYIRRGFIPVQHESDQEQTLLRWTWNR